MSSFRRNFSKLASGALIAQIIALASSPIVTRLYTPDDYGVFGLYIALSTILIMICTGRYHLAIVLPESDEDALTVIGLSLFIALVFAVLSVVFIGLFGNFIGNLLNAPEIEIYLWLIPLSILFRGIFLTFSYWSTRKKTFGKTAIANITESATGALSTIFAGLIFGSSIYGLIISRIFSALTAGVTLVTTTFSFDYPTLRRAFRKDKLIAAAKFYKKFPLISSWASILNTIAFMGPIILVSIYFNPVIVGLYTLANRALITPLSMVSNSLSQVIYQKFSSNHNANIDNSYFISVIGEKLFSIAFFPFLLIAFFGEELFSIIFGTNWAEAGIYAQILALYAFSRFISAPLMNICHTLNRQEVELYFNILLSLGRITAVIIGGYYEDIYLCFILLSVASMASYSILLSYILILSKVSLANYFRYITKIVLITIPLIILCTFLKMHYAELYFKEVTLLLILLLTSGIYLWALTWIDKDFRTLLLGRPR